MAKHLSIPDKVMRGWYSELKMESKTDSLGTHFGLNQFTRCCEPRHPKETIDRCPWAEDSAGQRWETVAGERGIPERHQWHSRVPVWGSLGTGGATQKIAGIILTECKLIGKLFENWRGENIIDGKQF